MNFMFGGSICEVGGCGGLVVITYVLAYRYYILGLIVLIGFIGLLLTRTAKPRRLALVNAYKILIITGLVLMLILLVFSKINSHSFREQEKLNAQAIQFDTYEFTRLPKVLSGQKVSISTFNYVKPQDPVTHNTTSIQDKKYTYLVYEFGGYNNNLATIYQFSKLLIDPTDTTCGTYNPEFPDQKSYGGCERIGLNSYNQNIYKAEQYLGGNGYVYISDIGDTRISIYTHDDPQGNKLSNQDAIRLMQSLKKVSPQDIKYQ